MDLQTDSQTRPGSAPHPERLIIADELARGILAAAAPLRFELARDDAQRAAVYRLRYKVVLERGWAAGEQLAGGMEKDHFDARALHIAGWDGDLLAATARLVLPEPGSALPTEEAFDLQVEPHGRVADMGRQIVDRDYSSVRHRVFAALLARTWLEMRRHGYSLVCGDFSPSVTRLYRMMGFNVEQLGPARVFWGEERFPIRIDIAASTPGLMARWGKDALPH